MSGYPDFRKPMRIAGVDVSYVPINVVEAIRQLSALKLMDVGVIKRVAGWVVNGTLVLYTVPSGKTFYIYAAMLNARHYATGMHTAYLYVYDGATEYPLILLEGPDSVEQMNEAVSFTVMSIPEGWSVELQANAYTHGYATVVGVEV